MVANLDAEASWARELRPSLPRPALSRAARRQMAVLGSLLRTFCTTEQGLWLPGPVDPERLPDHPRLPRPTIRNDGSVPGRGAGGSGHRLWGITAEWPAARGLDASDAEAPEPTIVARVNDRSWAQDLRLRRGWALPHSGMLSSSSEFERHLQLYRRSAGPRAPWVLKAPLSAAGRHRVLCLPDRPGPGQRAIDGLFRRHGELLFEPWMRRVDDFGALFSVDEPGLDGSIQFHRQLLTDRGHFRGIQLLPEDELGLGAALAGQRQVMVDIAQALADAGYRGPVAVDFWRYRRSDGSVGVHPLGEINARCSFARVARSLAARFAHGPAAEPRAELILAAGAALDRTVQHPTPQTTVVPLILPGPQDPTAAWLALPRDSADGL